MKKKPVTIFALVLDRSGSMAKCKSATISGFNEQVQQLKEDSKDQDIRVCLVTFNAEVFEHLWLVPADQLVEVNPESYIPLGGTAMRDAMGYTIQKLLDTTDPTDPEVAYVIHTISDGDSISDKHFSPAQLNEMIGGCEATKRWTFVQFGHQKSVSQQDLRGSVANRASWSNSTADGAELAGKNMRTRQKKFFAERLVGQTATRNYVSDTGVGVADFSDAEIAEVAPAPVLDNTPGVELEAWKQAMPKYVNTGNVAYNGGSLFGNSQKVEWEKRS